MSIEMCEHCEDDDLAVPATWYITGMGPGCGEWSCCGYEAWVCDEHKEQGLTAMSPEWGLVAGSLSTS